MTSLVSGVTKVGAGVRGMKWESPHTLLSCGYDTNIRLWSPLLVVLWVSLLILETGMKLRIPYKRKRIFCLRFS